MPRVYGRQYPARDLMTVTSDLLAIKHFTTSKGATVRKDFLTAVALGLGVRPAELAGLTKDNVLALVVERSTGKPAENWIYSGGETVTNDTLQLIVDGIIENGLQAAGLSVDDQPGTGTLENESEQEKERRLVLALLREGQSKFRRQLISAYGQRCAVTNANASESLDAAHIRPYNGRATNHVSNGLLLRADIHRLFDRGALAIHEDSLCVVLRGSLLATTYADLSGRKIRVPRLRKDRPSRDALRRHREWSGL